MEKPHFIVDVDVRVVQMDAGLMQEDINENGEHSFAVEIVLQIHGLHEFHEFVPRHPLPQETPFVKQVLNTLVGLEVEVCVHRVKQVQTGFHLLIIRLFVCN